MPYFKLHAFALILCLSASIESVEPNGDTPRRIYFYAMQYAVEHLPDAGVEAVLVDSLDTGDDILIKTQLRLLVDQLFEKNRIVYLHSTTIARLKTLDLKRSSPEAVARDLLIAVSNKLP